MQVWLAPDLLDGLDEVDELGFSVGKVFRCRLYRLAGEVGLLEEEDGLSKELEDCRGGGDYVLLEEARLVLDDKLWGVFGLWQEC